MARKRWRGFTLIELIIVITVTGLIMDVIARALVIPFRTFSFIRDRGELIYRANLIVQKMHHDLAEAVSASARVTTSGSSAAVEYLHAVDTRRYHSMEDDPGGNAVTFVGGATSAFNIWGPFSSGLTSDTTYTSNYQSLSFVIGNSLLSDAQTAGDTSLSVYSSANQLTGTTPGRIQTMPSGVGVITPKASAATKVVWALGTDSSGDFPNDGQVTFNFTGDMATSNPVFPKAAESQNQWVYVTDGPVSYVCDMSSSPGVLRRYSGYEIRATQPVAAADFSGDGTTSYQWRHDAPIVSTVLSDNVSACTWSYTNKILTLDITLAYREQTMRFIGQIYVPQ